MIPTIPELDGYILGPNGEQLRTPLQQIYHNTEEIKTFNDKIDNTDEWVSQLSSDLDDRVRIPNPSVLPEDATLRCLTIDGQHQTSAKEYSNQPRGNSIAQRTGGGGLLIESPSSSNALQAVNNKALETAQAMAYADSFSASKSSYPYRPYQFAAKDWKSWTGEGSITQIPTEGNWYQKLCNGSNSTVRVRFVNGARSSSASGYKSINNLCTLYTDKAATVNGSVILEPGLHDLVLTIQPHSVVQVYVRNRPASIAIPGGYTQICIM